MKYRCSRRQLKVINRKIAQAEAFGDLKGLIRCQSLFLIFSKYFSINEASEAIHKSEETVRRWLNEFLVYGCKSLKIKRSKGRQPKLSKADRLLLIEMLKKSPQEHGFPSGCWNSGLISILIEREFNVSYSVKYIPQLMKTLGFSWQRGAFEGALRNIQSREHWLNNVWPSIIKKAINLRAYILFEDESSFAMWGSLAYTWAPIGSQPIVKTSGLRKSYKVFGAIKYFTGKIFYQGIESKLNAESYLEFLKVLKSRTRKPLVLIHDSAAYHTDESITDFF